MAAGSKDWYDLYDTPCQPERGIHFHRQIAGGAGGWKGDSAVHTGGGSSGFFGECWPCKTCMVISLKSRKILTCIDLHHTVSLNGGLDGCSSILKAQYSQSAPKIFGKRGSFKGWLLELLWENSLWKTTACESFACDALLIARQQLQSPGLIRRMYSFMQCLLITSFFFFFFVSWGQILFWRPKSKQNKNTKVLGLHYTSLINHASPLLFSLS